MVVRVVLVVVLLFVAAVLSLAAAKPAEIHVQRSTRIAAPPERVFALIADFHHWPAWAPQDRGDPQFKRTYGGAASGPGAMSAWRGPGASGEGRMEIVSADPGRSVVVKVDFERPFKARNINTFVLAPDADGTRVSWTMQGTNPFLAKVMSVFVSPDRMMGGHFETGLANLKAEAEAQATKSP